MSSLRRAGLQAERAADTVLGAVLSAWENIRDTVTRARAPSRELDRAREGVTDRARKAERRGGTARKRVQRDLEGRRAEATRALRRKRGAAQDQVETARREAEERVGKAQSTAEESFRRAEERVRSLTGSNNTG